MPRVGEDAEGSPEDGAGDEPLRTDGNRRWGEVTAMFGLHVVNALAGVAHPWFLGTDRVFMHPRELLCIGRKVLTWWRDEYPCMENIVAADNDRAIRLLKHWGAEFGGEETHRDVTFLRFAFPAIQALALAA